MHVQASVRELHGLQISLAFRGESLCLDIIRPFGVTENGGSTLRNQRYRVAVVILALMLTTLSLAAAAVVRSVSGPFILAKPGPTLEFLWDATPYVAKLVADRTLGEDGLRAVEASAVSALVEKSIDSTAKQLKVTVVYKVPSASSLYGTPTFSDQQPLLDILIPRIEAAKSGVTWAQSIADGKTPSSVKVTITGKLPPAQ